MGRHKCVVAEGKALPPLLAAVCCAAHKGSYSSEQVRQCQHALHYQMCVRCCGRLRWLLLLRGNRCDSGGR